MPRRLPQYNSFANKLQSKINRVNLRKYTQRNLFKVYTVGCLSVCITSTVSCGIGTYENTLKVFYIIYTCFERLKKLQPSFKVCRHSSNNTHCVNFIVIMLFRDVTTYTVYN